MVRVANGPIIPEIAAGSGLYEHFCVFEIQSASNRKTPHLVHPARQYGFDHRYIFRIDLFLAGRWFVAENFHFAKLALICKDRIGIRKFFEGYLAASECQ